ncbi:hypothetical protein ScPMuIL_011018 [Solemya velum]
METKGLDHWVDIFIVALYFITVLCVGLLSLRCGNRGNVKGYFLAGRTMIWLPVGASLFSSNIGSEHFIGHAGAGAASGIALILFEWFPAFLILLLGWVFLPVYISAGVYTLPEYLGKRHGGGRIRIYLSCFALVLYIISKLAVSIFSGALFIQLAFQWNMYLSIALLLVVTALYTILGGLAAVMYTDTFQTSVMLIGAVVVSALSFNKIGGYKALETKYQHSVTQFMDMNETCGFPREDSFHVFRDPVNGDYPWPGLMLQSSLGCLWYWCCDQVIVQRALAAKSYIHAKGGAILAGLLKMLPLFLMIFPGMISRILYTDEVACVDPDLCQKYCDNPVGCSNIAYPKLVLELLPVGARGLLTAVMLSAIMSSLTSIFNSASTVFTMDLWRKIRASPSERELLIVGRIFVLIMCVLSVLWVPLVRSSQGGKLFIYMTSIEAYLGSPIGILFLMSIFWKRTTESAAFWGLIVAHVCGVTRLVLEFVYPTPLCGEEETRPTILYKLHYMYFSQLNLLLTAIVMVAISLFTRARSDEELSGVTWWSRFDDLKKADDISDVALKGINMEKTRTFTTFKNM